MGVEVMRMEFVNTMMAKRGSQIISNSCAECRNKIVSVKFEQKKKKKPSRQLGKQWTDQRKKELSERMKKYFGKGRGKSSQNEMSSSSSIALLKRSSLINIV